MSKVDAALEEMKKSKDIRATEMSFVVYPDELKRVLERIALFTFENPLEGMQIEWKHNILKVHFDHME